MRHLIGGWAAGSLFLLFFFMTFLEKDRRPLTLSEALSPALILGALFALAAWGLL